MNKRLEKAQQIVEAGMVTGKDNGLYEVQSQNGQGKYTVSLVHDKCYCPDWKKHGQGHSCKHILAARIYKEENKPATEKLLDWANELEQVSGWYDADMVRKVVKHGLATDAEMDAYRQLRRKYPGQALLLELDPVKEISTSGGQITVESGLVVNAWCGACKSSGKSSTRSGFVRCTCGNVIAEPREWMTADEILQRNHPVLRGQAVEL